jgi:hypothetical protein
VEARTAQLPKLTVRREWIRYAAPAWYLSRAERRELAGQRPYLLTELLTRLAGTGETARDADDDYQSQRQVSETRRDAGDAQDGTSYGS